MVHLALGNTVSAIAKAPAVCPLMVILITVALCQRSGKFSGRRACVNVGLPILTVPISLISPSMPSPRTLWI